jgi:HK97 family phage prohead protease
MKEYRAAKIQVETRAEGTAEPGARVLVGLPLVYDTPTKINDVLGAYTEIIARGALDGADISDARLLIGHDATRIPLARTPKTMQLTKTETGLEMRAELADTETANEAYTAVQRGALDGMSIAFTVPEGGDTYDRATNTRTIHKISKVYEVSLVAFPAYQSTSVEARAAMNKIAAPERDALRLKINKILFKER